MDGVTHNHFILQDLEQLSVKHRYLGFLEGKSGRCFETLRRNTGDGRQEVGDALFGFDVGVVEDMAVEVDDGGSGVRRSQTWPAVWCRRSRPFRSRWRRSAWLLCACPRRG